MAQWNRVPLIDYIELIGGGTPKTTVPEYWNGNIPWLSVKDFNNDKRYVYSTEKHISQSGFENSPTKMLHKDDIIISARGTVGEIAMIPFDMAFNQSCYGIRASRGIDQPFLYYLLKNCISQLKRMTHGSVFDTITRDTFANIEVDIPDAETQKRISSVLADIDNKIEVNDAINDNLEQQAQALYHERFETISPNDLPSEWRIVTLGEVATISSKSFNPLKEPEILLEHYSIPAFDEARFPVFELSTSIKSNKFIIDASCFMISKLNPTTKRVWKPYCLTGNAVCSTEFIVYKAKDKTITDFLYSVIDSNSFSDFMCSHVTGSTGSRQRTTPSDTLSYELILPSEDELAKFQSLVSPMYAQIRINAIENDRLKRLRDSLLPKLMSGEIDVSTIQL